MSSPGTLQEPWESTVPSEDSRSKISRDQSALNSLRRRDHLVAFLDCNFKGICCAIGRNKVQQLSRRLTFFNCMFDDVDDEQRQRGLPQKRVAALKRGKLEIYPANNPSGERSRWLGTRTMSRPASQEEEAAKSSELCAQSQRGPDGE